ncbi:MAG: GGDEF domain-containing protein [Spirochaetales bacterium]|nr:GGDEF domain-containing protein [Spirochaetales bacterium]
MAEKGMKRNKAANYRIGILIGKLEDSYQARIWPTMIEALKVVNAEAILFVGKSLKSPWDYDYQDNLVYEVINKKELDGLIVYSGALGAFVTSEDFLSFLSPFKNIPMVSLALSLPGIPSVLVDNKSGMEEMLGHLLGFHGYRDIAFIRGPEKHQEAEERYETYLKCLNDYHLPFNEQLVYRGDLQSDSGYQAMKSIWQLKKKPQAVVSANDVMALGALRFLQENNINCPLDIAVVGFDDIDESSFTTPPITTIQQPLHIQAQKSVEMLIKIIEKKSVSHEVIMPTRLIVRESCGCFLHDSDSAISSFNSSSEKKHSDVLTIIQNSKEEIINLVMMNLNPFWFQPANVKNWLNQLLEAFIKELAEKKSKNNFAFILNGILVHMQMNREYYSYWLELLQNLKISVLKLFSDDRDILFVRYLFQKAEVRLREIMMRAQYYRRTKIEKILDELNEISQRFLTAFDLEFLLYEIAKEFPSIGIDRFFIYLFDEPIKRYPEAGDKVPEKIKLVVSCENIDNKKILYREDQYVSLKDTSLIPFSDKSKLHYLICMPLYLREEQFGFIFVEIGPSEEIIYETLRFQISSAIKGAHLFENHKRAEEDLVRALIELEHTNKELKTLSLRDELTGLYNRRAFLTLGEQHLKLSQRSKRDFLLFFADLDNLKVINDNYGHSEGDFAIQEAGQILVDSFRKADIVARFGGDEYTIIAIDAGQKDIKLLLKNLTYNLKQFNKKSGKAYELSISIGVIHYNFQEAMSFDELLAMADQNLYKEKKKRKRAMMAEQSPP